MYAVYSVNIKKKKTDVSNGWIWIYNSNILTMNIKIGKLYEQISEK